MDHQEMLDLVDARKKSAKLAVIEAVSVAREILPSASDSALAILASAYLKELNSDVLDDRLSDIETAIQMSA